MHITLKYRIQFAIPIGRNIGPQDVSGKVVERALRKLIPKVLVDTLEEMAEGHDEDIVDKTYRAFLEKIGVSIVEEE